MRTILIAVAAVLCLSAAASAQDLKFGFVQVDALIANFPEADDAAQTYEKEVQSWQTQLNEYQKELEALQTDFKQKSMLYSPEKQREKQDEIAKKNQEAVKFYQDVFGPEGKAEKRKMELLSPIYEKVNRAIEILGQRDNFTMIFNAQGLLYAKDGLDLTEDVLKVLKAGVDVSPAGTRTGTGAGARSGTGTGTRR